MENLFGVMFDINGFFDANEQVNEQVND